ncbi:hypothetical protein KCU98_g15001, partial [Aureobasidium melanogenum]
MLSAKDIKSFVSPEWYSDAAIDAVVRAVIDAHPFPETYYQDAIMFTALVGAAEYWPGVRIADTVDMVTADLQHTLDHYRINGILPAKRVAQQENSFDCGPATVTTLIHTIKNEAVETGVPGLALRFAHLNILLESFMGEGCMKIEGQTGIYTAAYTTWKHSGQMADPLIALEYGRSLDSSTKSSSPAT